MDQILDSFDSARPPRREAVGPDAEGVSSGGGGEGGPARRPAVVACINKVDKLERSDAALPIIAALDARHLFDAIVPVAALRDRNLDRLLEVVSDLLPQAPHLFEEDEITDRPVRYLVSEIIREKLMRQLGDELPYQSAVILD